MSDDAPASQEPAPKELVLDPRHAYALVVAAMELATDISVSKLRNLRRQKEGGFGTAYALIAPSKLIDLIDALDTIFPGMVDELVKKAEQSRKANARSSE